MFQVINCTKKTVSCKQQSKLLAKFVLILRDSTDVLAQASNTKHW